MRSTAKFLQARSSRILFSSVAMHAAFSNVFRILTFLAWGFSCAQSVPSPSYPFWFLDGWPRLGPPEKNLTEAKIAGERALRSNDSLRYGLALLSSGDAAFQLGRLVEALGYFASAQLVFNDLENENLLTQSILGAGKIYLAEAETITAMAHFTKARAIAPQDAAIQGWADYYLAKAHFINGEFDAARREATEALRVSKDEKLPHLAGLVLNVLAELDGKEGNFGSAEKRLKRALALHFATANLSGQAESLQGLAQIRKAQNQPVKALKLARQAVAAADSSYHPQAKIAAQIQLSEMLAANDSNQAALRTAESTRIAINRLNGGKLFLQRSNSQQLAHLYLLLGDTAKSLEHQREFNRWNENILQKNIDALLRESRNSKGGIAASEPKPNSFLAQNFKTHTFLGIACLLLFAACLTLGFLYYSKKERAQTRALEIPQLNKTELQKQAENLSEREAELQEQRKELVEKNRELERLDKNKNKVISVLSHDLKQPFNQVKSALQLLEMDDLPAEDRRELLARLRETVNNSSNALENLLLWSKKQLRGIQTQLVNVHLLPQIWQMESLVKPSLTQKSLTLKIQVPDFLKIKADMNQLDICLQNLVNNAIKFSQKGGEILVKTKEVKNQVWICVQDSGVGMTAEQLQNLKDATENFSTSGTMNEKGTGLGLLIVRDFMKNQNGELKIESEQGKGSTFTLVFQKGEKSPIFRNKLQTLSLL